MMFRMFRILSFVLASAIWCSHAHAAYPERLIRMVVSAPAGTAPDIIARLIAPKMSEQLGQTIVIDNKSGANGNIAAMDVSKSAPDGYTLLMTVAGTLTANPSLYPKTAVLDLEPITQIATVDFIVAARPSLNVKTLGDLLTLIRKDPGKLNASTTAHGSFPHLAAEMMKQDAKVDFAIVKHNGGAAAGTSVAGEHTDFVIETSAVLNSFVKAGKLLPLASTGDKRSPKSPELPTVQESGVEGYSITGWIALVAPKGTPAPVTATVQKAVAPALADPAIRDRLAAMQFTAVANTPTEFGKLVAAERTKLGKTIQDAHLGLE